MIQIVAATPAMYPAILDLLQRFNNEGINRDRWRSILEVPWLTPDRSAGFVLWDGKVQGFISTLHSRRTLNGKEESFCNIGPWIVEKAYRPRAGMLLQKVLEMPCTFTALTPLQTVAKALIRSGFETLETERICFSFASTLGTKSAQLAHGLSEIEKHVSSEDFKLASDHSHYRCGHLAVRSKAGTSYALYDSRKSRFGISYAYFHHLSNPHIFAQCAGAVAAGLLLRFGSAFVVIEKRLLQGSSIALSKSVPMRATRLFRSSSGLSASQISNAYTELPMLGV